jgi:ABC-type branched-subunit amino acid transport system substrate-binding protein
MRICTLALLAAVLCASAWADTPVGVIVPYSGIFEKFGAKIRQGFEAGGTSGIHLIYEDEGCDAAKAVRAYKKLSMADRVRLLLGPMCGTSQRSVAPC